MVLGDIIKIVRKKYLVQEEPVTHTFKKSIQGHRSETNAKPSF